VKREQEEDWGRRGNASGGDVFREPSRSDRITVPIRTSWVCEVRRVESTVSLSAPLLLSPAWPMRLAGLFREKRLHSRRQLFANAAIAASRVAA
jgi:hypothetical protein